MSHSLVHLHYSWLTHPFVRVTWLHYWNNYVFTRMCLKTHSNCSFTWLIRSNVWCDSFMWIIHMAHHPSVALHVLTYNQTINRWMNTFIKTHIKTHIWVMGNNRPVPYAYKRDLQKETYKRDLGKRPTKETYCLASEQWIDEWICQDTYQDTYLSHVNVSWYSLICLLFAHSIYYLRTLFIICTLYLLFESCDTFTWLKYVSWYIKTHSHDSNR